MSGRRTAEEALMYAVGERSGEGARFEDGQERVKPDGSWVEGFTRKESWQTAVWMAWK